MSNKKYFKNKKKSVSARVTEELFDRLKDQQVNVTKVIRDALEKEVKGHKVVLNKKGKYDFKRVKIDDK